MISQRRTRFRGIFFLKSQFKRNCSCSTKLIVLLLPLRLARESLLSLKVFGTFWRSPCYGHNFWTSGSFACRWNAYFAWASRPTCKTCRQITRLPRWTRWQWLLIGWQLTLAGMVHLSKRHPQSLTSLAQDDVIYALLWKEPIKYKYTMYFLKDGSIRSLDYQRHLFFILNKFKRLFGSF